jgi:uncharacterized membrane protein YedE/YeeE
VVGDDQPRRPARRAAVPRSLPDALLRLRAGDRVRRAARAEARAGARYHVVGSVLFGVGWAVADVCPGPIAAQLGQGVAWSLATTGGLVLGVWLFLQRAESAEG